MKKLKKMVLHEPVIMSGDEMKKIRGGYVVSCDGGATCTQPGERCLLSGTNPSGYCAVTSYRDFAGGNGFTGYKCTCSYKP